jgi:hypothetical protein
MLPKTPMTAPIRPTTYSLATKNIPSRANCRPALLLLDPGPPGIGVVGAIQYP